MLASLVNVNLAVIGGDLRQVAVAQALAHLGGRVKTYGLPIQAGLQGITAMETLPGALTESAVVILPISGVNPGGRVNSLPDQPAVMIGEDFWDNLSPGALVLIGSLPMDTARLAEARGHRVIAYVEHDEIAILNSIPTAEGALQLAMENIPITIHGSSTFVLGLGRVGMSIARLFKAAGARVTVVANRPGLRARGQEMGCRAIDFLRLPDLIERADLVINTVPAPILPAQLILRTKPEVFLIDLASAPGGIDHAAAKILERRSILALSLPGKVAPVSAGQILAEALPPIILRELG